MSVFTRSYSPMKSAWNGGSSSDGRRHIERFSVTLEEVRGRLSCSVVRFDDHLGYHRHKPGWPQPSEEIAEDLSAVPRNRQIEHAVGKLRECYREWEDEIRPLLGEEP